MTSSNPLNFNDLPDEVIFLTFDLLTPPELALASPTCQRWHQIIMETKAWWRELEVEEDASFEKLMIMLRFFTIKSQYSMTVIRIQKMIEEESELHEIFSAITPNASTIKILIIRQESEFNLQTRRFAQTFPELKALSSVTTENRLKKEDQGCLSRAPHGLQYFATDDLFDLQDEELDWMSQLQVLRAAVVDSEKSLCSLLEISKTTLIQFETLCSIDSTQFQANRFPIVTLNRLSTLQLPTYPNGPAIILNIVAPRLDSFTARLSQVYSVQTSKLERLELCLEEEEAGEWREEQVDSFLDQFKTALSIHSSSLTRLLISALGTEKFQTQLSCLIGALFCSDKDESPLCPNLVELSFLASPLEDIEMLVKTVISRERFRIKRFGLNDFKLVLPEDTVQRYVEMKGGMENGGDLA